MGLEALIESIGEDWTPAAVGAVIGLAFGFLAHGCSSRLLVLAVRSKLRSVISGLVFAFSA